MARRANLQDLFGYVALRAFMGVLCVLPERLAYGVIGTAGRVFFRVAKRRRRIARDNLRLALGAGASDRELMEIGSSATANIFKTLVDLARLSGWRRKGRLEQRVDLSGLRPALAAVREEGFILISPHLGSWELGLAVFRELGVKISVIARKLQNPLLDRHVNEFRSRCGVEVYPRRGGMRHAVRALKSGRCLIAMPDQNQRSRGIFVPFFGKLASTERSIASLAVRMHVPILTTSLVRDGRQFRFTRARLLQVERTGDRAKDIEDLTVRMNRELERMILAYPEQYFWIHDRYRTRPPEERTWRAEALGAAQRN